MTIALVHGNPETAAIWKLLIPELEQRLGQPQSIVCLSPPGFGAPLAEGFGATSDDYLAWLADTLKTLDGPVDLIGHDWGGGHVARIAMSHPELIRSWCIDLAGCLDPEYVWHDLAQVWQTPGAGEQAVQAMIGGPVEERVARYAGLGMTPDIAAEVTAAADEDMGRAVLSLYRSAVQPFMSDIGGQFEQAAANPGLAIIPTADHFTGGEKLARRSAARANAEIVVLEGLGHWWMCENPAAGAEAIANFLNRLS